MKSKNKSDEAAKRRVRAARLLQAGHKPVVLAAMVGAPRQTVYRWRGVLEAEGIDALRNMSKGGRPALLGAEELVRLQVALMEGPTAHGFWHPAVDDQAGTCVHRARVWDSIQRRACLAPARADGLFLPETGTARAGARRSGDRGLEETRLAWAQKRPAERAG